MRQCRYVCKSWKSINELNDHVCLPLTLVRGTADRCLIWLTQQQTLVHKHQKHVLHVFAVKERLVLLPLYYNSMSHAGFTMMLEIGNETTRKMRCMYSDAQQFTLLISFSVIVSFSLCTSRSDTMHCTVSTYGCLLPAPKPVQTSTLWVRALLRSIICATPCSMKP